RPAELRPRSQREEQTGRGDDRDEHRALRAGPARDGDDGEDTGRGSGEGRPAARAQELCGGAAPYGELDCGGEGEHPGHTPAAAGGCGREGSEQRDGEEPRSGEVRRPRWSSHPAVAPRTGRTGHWATARSRAAVTARVNRVMASGSSAPSR